MPALVRCTYGKQSEETHLYDARQRRSDPRADDVNSVGVLEALLHQFLRLQKSGQCIQGGALEEWPNYLRGWQTNARRRLDVPNVKSSHPSQAKRAVAQEAVAARALDRIVYDGQEDMSGAFQVQQDFSNTPTRRSWPPGELDFVEGRAQSLKTFAVCVCLLANAFEFGNKFHGFAM